MINRNPCAECELRQHINHTDFVDNYTLIIILVTLGFFALAAILLVPVYLFLLKEEKISEQWTGDALAESVEKRYSSKRDQSNDEAQDSLE